MCAALCLLPAAPAFAQQAGVFNYFDYDHAWYADARYADILAQARAMPPGFPFISLRLLYMQSSLYDPLGEEPRAALLGAAKIARESADAAENFRALSQARAILRDHAGNLAIVSLGEGLCRADKRLGDAKFYAWLRDGILRDVLASGDGSSPENAYDVVTMEEEAQLLRALKFKPSSVETVHEGSEWYNMYPFSRAAAAGALFVNITYPLSKLEKIAQGRVRPLQIFPE